MPATSLPCAGCCFLIGGTQYHNQTFNAQTNKAMCSLLVLASIAIAMCALHGWPDAKLTWLPSVSVSFAHLVVHA